MNHSPKPSGLVIAAPSTGSGKTTVTLGLLRALRRRGVLVAPGTVGPDYIDPHFHEAACGKPCTNLDGWAMRPDFLEDTTVQAGRGSELLVAEGVMGLFDGGAEPGHLGRGSTADVARALGFPVLLVVDASGIGQSVAPLVHGFASFDDTLTIGGIILNKVAGERHEAMLREALAGIDVPILGVMPRVAGVSLPSRHLGLVQAGETPDLEVFIEAAADQIDAHIDIEAMMSIAKPLQFDEGVSPRRLPPLGQRIAVAQDIAFGFSYTHMLEGWRNRGAEISFFSPLGNETPKTDADAVFLPGGYPELHAGKLSGNTVFTASLREAAVRGVSVYGECGGYMVLGQGLVDADGVRHQMAGLLSLETSFEQKRLHLGYRCLEVSDTFAGFQSGDRLRAHEFHYAATLSEGADAPLFHCLNFSGKSGLRRGSVAGSFMHLIDVDGGEC